MLPCNNIGSTEVEHSCNRNAANQCKIEHLRRMEFSAENKNLTTPQHSSDASLRSEFVICLSKENTPPDLKLIMDAWSELPEAIRNAIVAMVQAVRY